MRIGRPFAGPFRAPLSKAVLRTGTIIVIALHGTPYLLGIASTVHPD